MDRHRRRRVLEEVIEVGFHTAGRDGRCPESFPFPACLASAIRYLGDEYPWEPLHAHGREWKLNMANVELLGASSMAFGLLWSTDWCKSCMDLTQVNIHDETIRRAFAWAGRDVDMLEQGDGNEETWRDRVVESIESGVPVLAFGMVGPPECCIITGYDEGGESLVGWSYFQDGDADREPDGRFRKKGWYPETWKLVLIGERTGRRLTPEMALRNGLEVMAKEESEGYLAGFQAYRAWISLLERGDTETLRDEDLRERHTLHHLLVGSHAEARCYGGFFLERLAEMLPRSAPELRECARCFGDIHDMMWEVWGVLGGLHAEEAWKGFREPGRSRMAHILRKARERDERAMGILEQVVGRETS